VYRLLCNTIYRGVFQWHGSFVTKAKARRRDEVCEVVDYPRPELRIVSDELWHGPSGAKRDSGKARPRAPYGSGKHLLSGLARCGECHALLTICGSNGRAQSLYCPACETSKRVGGRESWIGYSSPSAARQALEFVLTMMFTGEVYAEFQARLHARLTEGPAKEEQELRQRLGKLDAATARLKSLVMNPDFGADLFTKELAQTVHEAKVIQKRLEDIAGMSRDVNEATLSAQLAINPLELLHDVLLGATDDMYKVRATLRRLLVKFEFVAKPRRWCSVFRLSLTPGICLADLTGTAVLDSSQVEIEVTVSTTARRPVVWAVSGKVV